MNDEELFRREYLSKWIDTDPHYEKSWWLWVEYHYETERYDRGVCTSVSKFLGHAIPSNSEEWSLITRYAKSRWTRILNEKQKYRIDDEAWRKAKIDVLKYSYEDWTKFMSEKPQ